MSVIIPYTEQVTMVLVYPRTEVHNRHPVVVLEL
jgi:hypothetical protein